MRRRLIARDILESEDVDEDGSIDNYGATLDEEYESGLVEAGVRTNVTQSGTEEVEGVQRVVKYSSLSSYILKLPYFLTQGVNKNNKSRENLFNHMCNFWSRAEWKNGRRSASSYLGIDIRNHQYPLVNPTPLNCISGYIIEYSIGDRDLKILYQQSLNLIDGSISSYFSILNSPERICMIKQANELASVLCDIESDCLGSK